MVDGLVVSMLYLVAIRSTWLVPGWLTDRLWTGKPSQVCNQPPRKTQPSIPPRWVYQVPAYLAVVKAGHVHLCRDSR